MIDTRPRDYWCNDDEQMKRIEAALDLYESDAIGVCRRELNEALDDAEKLIREQAESLALLRELNDALVIPGWFQPRVDAVLDSVEEPTGVLDTPFLTAGGDPAEPKPDHNRIAAICELDGCCMLRDKPLPQQEKP